MGYWDDEQKTAVCFKPILSRQQGLPIPELAVWSGDTVRMDEEGYLPRKPNGKIDRRRLASELQDTFMEIPE